MKTDLDHLPQAKREQIQRIVDIVRGGATVEMIVLFGSHARGDWVRDPVHGYFSDFDFLVIVASDALADDPVLRARLTDQARQITGSALVSFIVHPVGEINHEIRCGQYFFSEIVSQGVLVHDSRRFTLAPPPRHDGAASCRIPEKSPTQFFGFDPTSPTSQVARQNSTAGERGRQLRRPARVKCLALPARY
jgi:predicted nucleotidyltransferase